MDFGMVRMRVADEDSSRLLWLVRIKPQSELRQVHPTFMELKLERGHRAGIYETKERVVKRAILCGVRIRSAFRLCGSKPLSHVAFSG